MPGAASCDDLDPPRTRRLTRWLGRLGTFVLLLVAFGLLLACWAPAYVGARDYERPHWRQNGTPGARPFSGPRPPR